MKPWKNKYIQALILSILIHCVLTIGLVRAPGLSSPPKTVVTTPLLEWADTSQITLNEPERTVVRSADVPEHLKSKEKKEARFASESDQYVLKETRARASGMTVNRSGLNLNPYRLNMSSEREREIRKKTESATGRSKTPSNRSLSQNLKQERITEQFSVPGDIAVGRLMEKDLEEGNILERAPLPPDMENGLSTIGDSLPSDIAFGDLTALNTDRFRFYSFYARIEEFIRHRWVNYVRAVMYTYQMENPNTTEGQWVTHLLVQLDANGNFVKGTLVRGSGIPGLDLAPVQAFREAHRIPNPPKEMVKDDGLVHLDYKFSVNFVPQIAGGE